MRGELYPYESELWWYTFSISSFNTPRSRIQILYMYAYLGVMLCLFTYICTN